MVSQYEHGPGLETPVEGQRITTKIKRVARAIYERDICDDLIPDELKWDDLAPWQQQEFYGMARVAIEAMGHAESNRAADEAMQKIWSEWFQFYERHFRGPGITISMADQMSFYEIAQPLMRSLAAQSD